MANSSGLNERPSRTSLRGVATLYQGSICLTSPQSAESVRSMTARYADVTSPVSCSPPASRPLLPTSRDIDFEICTFTVCSSAKTNDPTWVKKATTSLSWKTQTPYVYTVCCDLVRQGPVVPLPA